MKNEIEKVPIWQKVLLTVEEAAEYTNIGQNKLTELMRKPRCPFVFYVGVKKLIKRKELEKYISEAIQV